MEMIEIETKGHTDIVEITGKVQEIINRKKVSSGIIHLFVVGSTASVTTSEDDENLYQDLKEVLEEIIPYHKNWKHHQTWGDDNGAAHLRAAFLGPGLCVPVKDGKLLLGTWQKIILIDFDTSSRKRNIAVSITQD